jgi:hypothetical protein
MEIKRLCFCGRAERCYKAYVWCERGPEERRTGMSEAEGADLDALRQGRPVPGHLGACANLACSHGWLRHENTRGTSSRPGARCLIPGCPCTGLIKHTVTYHTLTRADPAS